MEYIPLTQKKQLTRLLVLIGWPICCCVKAFGRYFRDFYFCDLGLCRVKSVKIFIFVHRFFSFGGGGG